MLLCLWKGQAGLMLQEKEDPRWGTPWVGARGWHLQARSAQHSSLGTRGDSQVPRRGGVDVPAAQLPSEPSKQSPVHVEQLQSACLAYRWLIE